MPLFDKKPFSLLEPPKDLDSKKCSKFDSHRRYFEIKMHDNSVAAVSSFLQKHQLSNTSLEVQVLLSGCSAGGLATFFHCDSLKERLGVTVTVKCLSDAGFFLDLSDISGKNTIRQFFSSLVSLQGVQKNLNIDCLNSADNAYLCFFPQFALPNIRTPFFILNSAYDVYQFHHRLVPPSSDSRGHWSRCVIVYMRSNEQRESWASARGDVWCISI